MGALDINLSVLSTEYVQVPVAATAAGIPVNPTNDVVQFAFMTSGNPTTLDWHNGSWDTTPGGYLARCLVGPAVGAIALAAGSYTIWLKIVDNPEIPVQQVGTLKIT